MSRLCKYRLIYTVFLLAGLIFLPDVAPIRAEAAAATEFLTFDSIPEGVNGNVARMVLYDDAAETPAIPFEERWYDDSGRLYRKDNYQPGSVTLTTRYDYCDHGKLKEWYQLGINSERLWGYLLEYDDQLRPLRMITQGQGGAVRYLEDYIYSNDTLQESVLYNAHGEPVWRRKIEQTGNELSWEVLQPNGELFSQGMRRFEDDRTIFEVVKDRAGSTIEKKTMHYDEHGRLLRSAVYDSARLLQESVYTYMNHSVSFVRTVEPQPDGRAIQHEVKRIDSYGNWVERIHTQLFESNGTVEVVESSMQRREIEYRE